MTLITRFYPQYKFVILLAKITVGYLTSSPVIGLHNSVVFRDFSQLSSVIEVVRVPIRSDNSIRDLYLFVTYNLVEIDRMYYITYF